jgi:hypothetical protein
LTAKLVPSPLVVTITTAMQGDPRPGVQKDYRRHFLPKPSM